MSDKELRRWAIELVISKLPRSWLSMFIISEILVEYIRDGKLPPLNDENNLDLSKWLENTQQAPDTSNEEPAHV
ncbi:hypothetical protein [Gluconobacter sp. DsW_058]|uniref:hypothetical protein n=1 Tax=Gluconobacter sp. DsW_058 TaxID=1511210 RepID=UPI000A38A54D|nr:hypothetical protein [Gluconobacter sp. DsW_058]OUJ04957.1 hypothetical protein HK24_13275 [Gluconobacter sp. DsW_058]